MDRDEGLAALREVAVEVLSVEPDTVTYEARFKEDLDADSLDLVELVMGLEERFDISVPEEDLEGVATVGQAVDLVLAKVTAAAMSDAARDHLGRPRVAVTGIGVKAPAGNDLESFWATVRAGKSMARTIEQFDPTDPELPVRFACELRDFDPVEYFGPKEVRRQDRVTHFGFAAASDAINDAGELGADPSRCAVIAATGVGGLTTLQENVTTFLDKGPSRVSPFFVPMMMPNATAGAISIHFGFTGPALCISTACAAGANGIGEAARMIRDSSADVVVAGGTEAFTSVTVAAFARMGALSSRNDQPELASRPFDAERDGFVIGEGAAFVVLETPRARAGTRCPDLRRGVRVRTQRRCVPHHRTLARRRRRRDLHAAGAGGRRARPVGHRPDQRPRHLDPDERHHRGRGDPQGVR